jgi:hypothetical protein
MIEYLDFIVIPYFRGIELHKDDTKSFELHESIEMLIDSFIESYDDNDIKYQFNILNLLGNWLCKKGDNITLIYFNYYDCMSEHIYSDINYGYITVAYISGDKDFYRNIFNILQKWIYDKLDNMDDTREYIIKKYEQLYDIHNFYIIGDSKIPRWCKIYLKYILDEREKKI